MKRIFIVTALTLTASLSMSGQGVMDALNSISTQTKGTARYSAMAGAFGALGGDITSIKQNPAGIGVYRSSELSVTAGFNFYDNHVDLPRNNNHNNDFYFTGDNLGVIGVINFKSGALRNLNFGFAYNNVMNFNNAYRADWSNIHTSLTQLIASKASNLGCPPADLGITSSYNPYNTMPWLPVLGYNTHLIYHTSVSSATNQYNAIYNTMQSRGSAYLTNITTGGIDEYDFNISGNIKDVFYWGLSINVTNISYHMESYYGEELQQVNVNNNNNRNVRTSVTDGSFELSNYLLTKGYGTGVKLGLIYRPINLIRLGFAVHTPTYYNMTDTYSAAVDYAFNDVDGKPLVGSSSNLDNQTDIGQIGYKFTSPWHFLGSMAFVFNKGGILSLDYEYTTTSDMYYSDIYADYSYTNNIMKSQVQGIHNIRAGAEFRITPLFSVRAGYSFETSPLNKDYFNGRMTPLIAEGTICHYQVPGEVHNVSCGLGYRYNNIFIDAAYVFRTQDYSIFAYEGALSDSQLTILNTNNHSIKLTFGYRF